jgi:hypothetical protein
MTTLPGDSDARPRNGLIRPLRDRAGVAHDQRDLIEHARDCLVPRAEILEATEPKRSDQNRAGLPRRPSAEHHG